MQAKRAIGICLGASSIKLVEIDKRRRVIRKSIRYHECDPKKTLLEMLSQADLDGANVAITGRKFKELLNLPSITEPEATEYAFRSLGLSKCNGILSLGGESFIFYEVEQGSIIKVQTGNKCASGTGEFMLQQIRRMGIDLDEAISSANGSVPHHVSGRCSVFCKSDCTHALNIGIPKGQICAGLGNMIADKAIELLQSAKKENIVAVGGVTQNAYVISRLRKKIKNLIVPKDAEVFEAFGAAVYALKKGTKNSSMKFNEENSSFSTLPSLLDAKRLVSFKDQKRAKPVFGEECVLGLDVGSTTTKAVLLRTSDNTILSSIYLRTKGDPVGASRECYKAILAETDDKVTIIGLGVTGSGRQIAGLHALTDGVINEIIAHATAAVHFDKGVDTILEIGGQDAKYTFLVNGVPCDYAMNEACSAGTGSFLEEAAKESLNIDYLEIEKIAMKAKNPPNFNDQCAAFISSDIKVASHENIRREDIVAGLVYSICMNYINRVKGSRKIGRKVFMQGGVCYNKAVPLAMAGLLGKEITVPPDPGLMGAFGVALEVKNRIGLGLLERKLFSLRELADREVEYLKPFTCAGQPENCDRKCEINLVRINGKSYPFGGVCNKYYNMLHNISVEGNLDMVEERNKLLFKRDIISTGKRIGINRSFYTYQLFPLYYHFFSALGFEVILPEYADPEGIKKVCSSFCFPAELSHGMLSSLLLRKPDILFLPQVSQLYVEKSRISGRESHNTCVFCQSEPYYLRSAFRDFGVPVLSPVLDFSKGWETAAVQFADVGRMLGKTRKESLAAYAIAVDKQKSFVKERKRIGQRLLDELKKDRTLIAVVLFGRAYNSFADEANLGIPSKFASRGIRIIPYDCLPYEHEESIDNMTWASGQEIIKAARFVKKHGQLYAAYITNFSCGPDSFLITYFRDIMKTKPSLTLELDSHSADAGINTRIEAFLDIVERYRKLGIGDPAAKPFRMARIEHRKGRIEFISSDGKRCGLTHPSVKVIMPSMGRIHSELAAACFNGMGIRADAVPTPDFKTLMLGRAHTSCKECLPLILTTASLMDHVKKRKKGEKTVYFMPTTRGSCRFSQYYVFINQTIEKNLIRDVALLSFTSDNSYAGVGIRDQLLLLKAVIIGDIMDDVKNAIQVLAVDKDNAMDIFETELSKLISCFKKRGNIHKAVRVCAKSLKKIPLKMPVKKAARVLMAGEIYVRRDEFSSQPVVDMLAKRGIVVKRSGILEWLIYVDYLNRTLYTKEIDIRTKAVLFFRRNVLNAIEKSIKSAMVSGLYEYEHIDMDEIMRLGSLFMNPRFTGETILGVGGFFHEVARNYHGMISIGPFACLPTRVVESILSQESKVTGNDRLYKLHNYKHIKRLKTLPFLSIESDGNPFPQIVEARLEAFALQVEKMHRIMNRTN